MKCKNNGVRRHGMSKTTTHKSWREMLGRCRQTKGKNFPIYGARGIKVCKRWQRFENFLADMGLRPVGLTLDRINNDGNYTPSNCRWATASEQARNRRTSKIISFAGRSQTQAAWAQERGISQNVLFARLKSGWSIQRALTEPRNV